MTVIAFNIKRIIYYYVSQYIKSGGITYGHSTNDPNKAAHILSKVNPANS